MYNMYTICFFFIFLLLNLTLNIKKTSDIADDILHFNHMKIYWRTVTRKIIYIFNCCVNRDYNRRNKVMTGSLLLVRVRLIMLVHMTYYTYLRINLFHKFLKVLLSNYTILLHKLYFCLLKAPTMTNEWLKVVQNN